MTTSSFQSTLKRGYVISQKGKNAIVSHISSASYVFFVSFFFQKISPHRPWVMDLNLFFTVEYVLFGLSSIYIYVCISYLV